MDRKLEVIKIIIVPKLTYEVKYNSILIPIWKADSKKHMEMQTN